MTDGIKGGWEYGSATPSAATTPAPPTRQALDAEATVTGKHVRLRPLDTDDYPSLYFMEQDPVMTQRFRHRGHTVPPERYGEALWSGVDCQYAIESTQDGTLVGIVNIHSADQANMNARLALLIRPDLHNRAWPLEALPLFIDHVFRAFPYRKLYADVTDDVFESFTSGSGIEFDIEGRLVDHHWIEGRWQDLLVLAVHRSKWEKRQAAGDVSLSSLLIEEAGRVDNQ